jgi:hypothetical protein
VTYPCRSPCSWPLRCYPSGRVEVPTTEHPVFGRAGMRSGFDNRPRLLSERAASATLHQRRRHTEALDALPDRGEQCARPQHHGECRRPACELESPIRRGFRIQGSAIGRQLSGNGRLRPGRTDPGPHLNGETRGAPFDLSVNAQFLLQHLTRPLGHTSTRSSLSRR